MPREKRAVSMVPNMVTLLALALGLTAVKFAADGDLLFALAATAASAVCDALDGRVARMLDAASSMGAELDSLCDAISFGVAPALVVYFGVVQPEIGGTSPPTQALGWAAVLIYVACIVLRLARFNTMLDVPRPQFTAEFFVGVPAPAAALLALCPVLLVAKHGPGWWSSEPVLYGWLVGVGILAVSRVPTLSGKNLTVSPRYALPILVGFAVVTALIITRPLELFAVLIAAYLLHIPYAMHRMHWLCRHPSIWDVPPAQRREIQRTTAIRKVSRRDGRQNRRQIAGVNRRR